MSSFIGGSFQSFTPQFQSFTTQFPGTASRSGFGSPVSGSFSPQALLPLLQSLIGVLSQLGSAWGGFAGQQQPQQQYPQQTFGGYPQQNLPQSPYGTNTPGGVGVGGVPTGGYGSTAPGAPNVANYTGLRPPSDPRDYASYLQAQLAGGTLQGGTSISQADAIPGTRFAQVQSPQLWHADVARNYAFQFAAFASGNDPLSPQGLHNGAQAMQQMTPEAQLFMQVASVFKGNLFNGPGQYDNPGLQRLLASKGATDLAGLQGVGQTDVQTIGAVTAAINRGQLSLQDIINSGTIDNLDRYSQVINYVQSGRFGLDVNAYDNVPL